MKPRPHPRPPAGLSTVSLVIALAIGIAVALGLLFTCQRDDDDDAGSLPADGAPGTEAAGDTTTRVRPGDTLTRPTTETVADPPTAVDDPIRVRNLYREGVTYRKTIRTTIEGRGVKRDWGLEGSVNFALASKQVVDLEIEENDGRNIVARLTVGESVYTELFTRDYNLRMDLGPTAHRIIDGVAIALALADAGITLPPGTSRLLERQFNQFLADTDLGPLLSDFNLAPSPPTVDALSGVEIRVHYTDGLGITRMELLRASTHRDFGEFEPYVNHDDLLPLFNANPVLDLYFFPEQSREVGGEWSVDAGLLPMPLPWSWQPQGVGRVNLRRLADQDGAGRIELGPDRLELAARPGADTTISGRLELGGMMAFQHIDDRPVVDRLALEGSIDATRLDEGWIFDTSASGQVSKARVEYTLRILD